MTVNSRPDKDDSMESGSPITAPPASGPQRSLASLLGAAYGGLEPAHAAIEQALATTGREKLPVAGPALLAFVRAHLIGPLTDSIGPRLTLALISDLERALDPQLTPPPFDSSRRPSSVQRPVVRRATHPGSSSRPRVAPLNLLLVDEDRVGRAALARALVRAEMSVTVIETLDELLAALDRGEPVDALLMDAVHPEARAIVETLLERRPGIAVVARTGDPTRTRTLLTHLAVARFDVRSREAPPEELCNALKRTAAG